MYNVTGSDGKSIDEVCRAAADCGTLNVQSSVTFPNGPDGIERLLQLPMTVVESLRFFGGV